jgi:hypothetical protein
LIQEVAIKVDNYRVDNWFAGYGSIDNVLDMTGKDKRVKKE